MPPSLADRVRHILEAHAEIDRAIADKTYDDFAANGLLRAAVERLLERICEATRHIPDTVKSQEPTIAWPRIIDFGNRLRHAYHSIDSATVWQVAKSDLRPLRDFAERIVRDEQG